MTLDIVVFGLSITSSWGNGHATTYRALIKALARRGHRITFLERDVPWYAEHRDQPDSAWCTIVLYRSADDAKRRFAALVGSADLVIVGSYVPDGVAIGEWVLGTATGVTAFYDIDTPVTLAALDRGDTAYLAPGLIPRYDLYLSFTGGPTLGRLERDYGSPCARALYCAVDPELHGARTTATRWTLGYLGTYSDDRQPTLQRLLLDVAERLPDQAFVVAGPQYPEALAWPANVERIAHLSPREHPDFYGAQRFTLNVTRADMIDAGFSPSVRLFEAAACGVPIISDAWDGLDTIFAPDTEILVARTTADVLSILRDLPETQRRSIAANARTRVLRTHTADCRARELETHFEDARAARHARKDQRAYA